MPAPSLEPFTNVFFASQKRKIVKRTRQPISCVACRRSKLKCDKQIPCGRCKARGNPEHCRFTNTKVHQLPKHNVQASLAQLGGVPKGKVQASLAELEELVRTLAASEKDKEGGAEARGTTSWSAVVLEKIHAIRSGLNKEDDDGEIDNREGDKREGDRREGDGREGDRREGDKREGDKREGDGREGDRREGDRGKGDRGKGEFGPLEKPPQNMVHPPGDEPSLNGPTAAPAPVQEPTKLKPDVRAASDRTEHKMSISSFLNPSKSN
ncbi:hypothetical protein QQZ08_004622 [Neonectria magnoliae]|uniref:Zn(2)-C6 fungal-type domain-containing protein n=1 Tax=Neonectria magnoliae TaxID=2732573 RepID=A0ABR1I7N6_9HYPO